MNKLISIVLLIGCGALWRDSGGEIIADGDRYKLEYSGAIGTQSYGNFTSQHARGKKSVPTNKISKNSHPKPTVGNNKSTFLAAGISFPQGAFSVRVVREQVAPAPQQSKPDRSQLARLEGQIPAKKTVK